jgi:radical SAM superfamily enzyme YgiQ (UPF0313 family)
MEAVDILYIHPLGANPSFSLKYFNSTKDNSEHYFGFIPMGIIAVVNNLVKNGVSVKGVNLPLKKRVNPSFDLSGYLDLVKPKIVLIDMHWYVHLKDGLRVAKLCKEHGCKVVAGGLSATLFYKQLLNFVDFVVKGDAEKPLLELVKGLLGGNDVASVSNIACSDFDNPIGYVCTDIDDYDYVNLDFLEDKDSYLRMFDFWLMTGKGCPYNCENCDGNRASTKVICGRTKTIFRSRIVDDLKRINADTIGFSMDIDIMPKEIIDEISGNSFDFNLRNEFFQLADVSRLSKIKNSFNSLDLVFSPTSGSDSERKRFGKNFTNAEFLKSLKDISSLELVGGVIVYFTDYMVSPLKVEELDSEARENLVSEIKKIFPYAVVEILPQVVDPGSLRDKISNSELFKIYSS